MGWWGGGVENSHDCSASLGVTEQHSQSTVSIMNILSFSKSINTNGHLASSSMRYYNRKQLLRSRCKTTGSKRLCKHTQPSIHRLLLGVSNGVFKDLKEGRAFFTVDGWMDG